MDKPETGTILLVGGSMCLEDGSTVDSRQSVQLDSSGEAMRKAVAGSLHWWMTVSSIVTRALANKGDGSFALIIGGRSVLGLEADDTTKRTNLRKLLPGGVGTVSVIRSSMNDPVPEGYMEAEKLLTGGQVLGTVGFKLVTAGKQWYFLDGNEYYLRQAGASIAPAVVVDTSAHYPQLEDLEAGRLFSDLLVLPHTSQNKLYLDRYAQWRSGKRVTAPPSTDRAGTWDPNRPPDPIEYTVPVVVSAEFGITGYFRDGQWQDPAGPEAARSLLESRFNLKIGFWDLVNNGVLRRSLLKEMPQGPLASGDVTIPQSARDRAAKTVAGVLEERRLEAKGFEEAVGRLLRALNGDWKPFRPGEIRLELTERVCRWPGDEPWPLVSINVAVLKRRTQASLSITLYNQVNLKSYLREHASAFQQIAESGGSESIDVETGQPNLWRVGGGWADEVSWEDRAKALAEMSTRWISELEALCNACRIALTQRT